MARSDKKKHPQPSNTRPPIFERVARAISQFTGSTTAFLIAALVVLIWAATGPLFDYSTNWQLVINTGTTIVTFLGSAQAERDRGRPPGRQQPAGQRGGSERKGAVHPAPALPGARGNGQDGLRRAPIPLGGRGAGAPPRQGAPPSDEGRVVTEAVAGTGRARRPGRPPRRPCAGPPGSRVSPPTERGSALPCRSNRGPGSRCCRRR